MMHFPGSIAQKLDEPYPLTAEQVEFYQQHRFIKLKQVFDEETIRFFNHQISIKVEEMRGEVTEMDSRDTYGKAFVQLFNLWLEDNLCIQQAHGKDCGRSHANGRGSHVSRSSPV